jgi:hypothetical protein
VTTAIITTRGRSRRSDLTTALPMTIPPIARPRAMADGVVLVRS